MYDYLVIDRRTGREVFKFDTKDSAQNYADQLNEFVLENAGIASAPFYVLTQHTF